MKHTLHGLGIQPVAGLVLAISGLLLMSSVKVANADGSYIFNFTIESNVIKISHAGSTATFSSGTTTMASCSSVYNAGPSSSPTSASAQGNAEVDFIWQGADGELGANSQYPPTGDWNLNRSSEAEGSASLSGASGSSVASASSTSGPSTASGSAPSSYDKKVPLTTYAGTPGLGPSYGSYVSAHTSAGPDSSA